MKYRQLGDWQVSTIGLGCYGLSGAYGRVNREGFRETIQSAFDQGVNFFDTAEGYGEAESFLGKAVAPFRDQVYIATKVSGESGVPDLSTSAVRAACEGGLKRLATDVIDLYQVHFDDPHTPVLETVTALESLVEDGKIRAYGVGHLPIDRVQTYADTGSPVSVMMELSPVARTALDRLLPLCQERGMAALAFSVTGRGILSGQYRTDHIFEEGDIRRMDPLFQRERLESALQVRSCLADIGKKRGWSALQVGIAWVLAQTGVACALTGTSSPHHLQENLAASEIELDEELLAEINSFLSQEDVQLKSRQSETIRGLLNEPLPDDPGDAFNDLVYVMETMVETGQAREDKVIPAFQELFALRNTRDENTSQKMAGIQQYLRGLLGQS